MQSARELRQLARSGPAGKGAYGHLRMRDLQACPGESTGSGSALAPKACLFRLQSGVSS